MKKVEQLLHLFGPHTGLHVMVHGTICIWTGVVSSVDSIVTDTDNGRERSFRVWTKDIVPIVHRMKNMRDEHLFKVGEMICHIPNSGANYRFEEKRTGNTVGGKFISSEFRSDEYFGIFTEKNGYIEHGWYSDDGSRKPNIKRKWRSCSFHDVTLYLLEQHYWLWEDEYFDKGLIIDADKLDSKVSDGCTCQSCGSIYKMDLMIPDDLWVSINGSGEGGLLCPTCIVKALENIKGFSTYALSRCRLLPI